MPNDKKIIISFLIMTEIMIIKSVYSQIDFNNLLYKYRSGNTLDFRSIPNANKLFDET